MATAPAGTAKAVATAVGVDMSGAGRAEEGWAVAVPATAGRAGAPESSGILRAAAAAGADAGPLLPLHVAADAVASSCEGVHGAGTCCCRLGQAHPAPVRQQLHSQQRKHVRQRGLAVARSSRGVPNPSVAAAAASAAT
jgi:hypothetical protein